MRGDDDTLRDRLSDWWFDVRWWFRERRTDIRCWWRERTRSDWRDIPLEDMASALQALADALTPAPGRWPWQMFGACPLHPKNVSTPFGARCCFNPVLQVEDLSPVMKVVTFSDEPIRLRKRFFGPSSNPEMKLEPTC